MDERLGVLQHVVDTLDDVVFAQHYLVPQRHELVLHVGLYASDEVYAVVEEVVKEFLQDVSAVGEQLAVQVFCQHLPYLGVAVVGVGSGEAEGDDLRPVVADEVQLEAVAQAHSPHAVVGKPSEHLVHVTSDVMADG